MLINLAFGIFAVVVFYYIYINTDWKQAGETISRASLPWMLAAFFISMFSHLLRALRWNALTAPAGYPLNKRRSFYAVMVGYIVNVGTSRGGEVVRCALAARSEKAPLALLIGTVFTERIVDLCILLLFCVLCLILQFEYIFGFFDKYILTPIGNAMTPVNIGIGIGLLLLIIFLFAWLAKRRKAKKAQNGPRKEGILSRFLTGLNTIFSLKNPWLFILMSLGIWVGYWISAWCTLQALDITQHIGILSALSVVIFSAVGIAIPVPAGAGVWGAVAFGLTTVYGMPEVDAKTYGIFNLAVTNFTLISGGAICFFLYWLEMRKIENNARVEI